MNCKWKNQILLETIGKDQENKFREALKEGNEIVAVLDSGYVVIGKRDCENCPVKCKDWIISLKEISRERKGRNMTTRKDLKSKYMR